MRIQNLLDMMIMDQTGKTMEQHYEDATCTWCSEPVSAFRDPLSAKEYSISGFCQKCQDETFLK